MCADCNKKNEKTGETVGKAVGEAVVGGFGLLGRGTVWLARVTANGTAAAGKGIAEEYKRQQKEGFCHQEVKKQSKTRSKKQ